jgi:hemerythrin
MLTIAWDDNYLLELPTIDNQHKYLFNLLNTLYDDVATIGSDNYLEKLFADLSNYAAYHFALEERWMDAQHFPLLESHRREHRIFADRVAEMERDYRQHHRNVSQEALSFLYNWLTTHIQGSDHEFGRFIRQKSAELDSHSAGLSSVRTRCHPAACNMADR